MAKTTISFGVVLILLGIFGYAGSHSHTPLALIPAAVGLALSILGFLAMTDDAKKRMLFMHVAVTIGLLGFLATIKSVVDYFHWRHGAQFAHPVVVQANAAMSILLLVFVIFCVRSFIAARKARA